MHLHRDIIVSQALELVDSYGLADMTMRRVANSLGVAPGALYWHIANKQELITAVASKIVAPVLADAHNYLTPSLSPHELGHRLRECLLAHRDGAEVVHSALSQPESKLWQQLREVMTCAISSSLTPPLSARDIELAAASILHLTFGASIMEQSERQFRAMENSAQTPKHAADDSSTPVHNAEVDRGIALVLSGLSTAVPATATAERTNQEGSL